MHREYASLSGAATPVAKLVMLILLQANDSGVDKFSYFEDGQIEPEWCPTPPAKMAPNILNRLKIIAGLEPLRYQTPVTTSFELVVLYESPPFEQSGERILRCKVTVHDYLEPRRVDVEMELPPWRKKRIG